MKFTATRQHAVLTLCLLPALLSLGTADDHTPSLAGRLQAFTSKFVASAPAAHADTYQKGIDTLAASGIAAAARNTGDTAPGFTLSNAVGREVSLASLLEKGPVVLTWYRGGWCPYCNISLLALQDALPEITAAGAQLVALTPELPDKSLSTTEKNELDYQILSDLNLDVARDYGLVYKLTPDVARLLSDSFDLADYNGPDAPENELPLAATYIVGSGGKILWSFVQADYRKRAEPADIVAFLREKT